MKREAYLGRVKNLKRKMQNEEDRSQAAGRLTAESEVGIWFDGLRSFDYAQDARGSKLAFWVEFRHGLTGILISI